jgi:hypothetical protein
MQHSCSHLELSALELSATLHLTGLLGAAGNEILLSDFEWTEHKRCSLIPGHWLCERSGWSPPDNAAVPSNC